MEPGWWAVCRSARPRPAEPRKLKWMLAHTVKYSRIHMICNEGGYNLKWLPKIQNSADSRSRIHEIQCERTYHAYKSDSGDV